MEPLPTHVSKAIIAARSRGTLNLGDKELTEVPRAVYNLEVRIEGDSADWWHNEELRSVVLSRNALTELPDGLATIESMQVLDVSFNQLRSLPENLPKLPRLKLLDVSNNLFQELPTSIATIAPLAKLACTHNQLSSLPNNLGQEQDNLAEVNASNNVLTSIPSGLAHARSLRKLSLAKNRITSLPHDVLTGLANLLELDVSENQLSGPLPESIGCCTSLQILSLKQNKLTELPPSIGLCTSLVELLLGFNSLSVLPDEVGLCVQLRNIDVRNNRIHSLGKGVATLKLNMLDLTNNELKTLPLSLGNMTTLRAMPVVGNLLTSIPRSIREGRLTQLLEHLRMKDVSAAAPAQSDRRGSFGGSQQNRRFSSGRQSAPFGGSLDEMTSAMTNHSVSNPASVNLASKDLDQVQDDVWHPSLVSIDISKNRITQLNTSALALCPKLSKIIASNNLLHQWPLPSGLGCLGHLVCVDLSGNLPLEPLPNDALSCCLSTLRELNLSGCPRVATSLDPISRCSGLANLMLSNCQLTSIPESVLTITSLTSLDLSSNQVVQIPDSITRLTHLTCLNLTNNDISMLPPQLSLLPLQALMVQGNRLRSIRRAVLDQGTEVLMAYLEDRMPF